jgi:hypothetical protein
VEPDRVAHPVFFMMLFIVVAGEEETGLIQMLPTG